ncbi:helix-turn-helix domain-containing protein [Conexibacter sp. W3-3-2]|uniref:helix-turn-helix domain-containing protein n=1 Tax=Conexibacter sp. W3-3-2 TaxID=2675227 RepID=UPI0018AAE5B7|nr:helix-turn-helix domain-containing protein [Conexibacter sp. W3-3-2]
MDRWIEENFGDPSITAAIAAEQLGVHERTLRRALEGEGWRRRLSGVRMREARRMLEEQPSVKVAVVARACGFDSPTSFAAAFKRTYRTTPAGWRLGHGGRRRAGGATGAARQSAARARAARDGEPPPSMSVADGQSTAVALDELEWRDAERRARYRRAPFDEEPPPTTLSELAALISQELDGPRGYRRLGRRRPLRERSAEADVPAEQSPGQRFEVF